MGYAIIFIGGRMAEKKKAEVAVETSAMSLLRSSKTQETLVTVEGKQKFSADIESQANQIIRAKKPAQDRVVGEYFTSFVIQ